ncbi:hypothetical protein [Allopontixanthobacter sp.]|uniref:hypothetical protein n=1 Tax=Allopontixanthobacter sp. TaxID=2906452 RepID=UPI002ABA9851|nr:hypothetical protein [Allopontixanthobacter sp.]MDZ4306609.1 hypothetical protein [Allopontixanthobacter sp.]
MNSGAAFGADRGAMALAEARRWIGTPVKWEQSLKGQGCDCRGLVAGVARALGWEEAGSLEARIAGYARGRIDGAALKAGLDRLFDPVEGGLAQARAGDVVGLRINDNLQHLAIHAGVAGGYPRMVHAFLSEPAQVVEVPMVGYWQRRVAGIWRWREPALSSAAAGDS